MSDLDDLRENLLYSKHAEAQSNKWLYGLLFAFPLIGLGGGFAYKTINNNKIDSEEYAQIITPQPSDATVKPIKLSENKTFLKMAKTKKNDPYILASDQLRIHNTVTGKLEACGKKSGNVKFSRLKNSYTRRNKSAHDKNQKIILARTTAQAKEFENFKGKVVKGNKTQQMATILGAKASGGLNQHTAIMANSMSMFGGYSSRSLTDEECIKLSTEISTGKNNITAPKPE